MDPANWKGGKTPRPGQTVVFPTSFNDFGSTKCTGADNCPRGSTVAIKPDDGKTPAVTHLKTLIFPRGKIRFAGASKFVFSSKKQNDSIPTVAAWDDHGSTARDYSCANNWVVVGKNGTNPNFLVPCAEDKVLFPEVI